MSGINLSNTSSNREELRRSILDAVSGKEDVISSFAGTKKNKKVTIDRSLEPQRSGLAYLLWNFLGGLFFGTGILVMVVVTTLVLSNFDAVRTITSIFDKFVGLLQSLGK